MDDNQNNIDYNINQEVEVKVEDPVEKQKIKKSNIYSIVGLAFGAIPAISYILVIINNFDNLLDIDSLGLLFLGSLIYMFIFGLPALLFSKAAQKEYITGLSKFAMFIASLPFAYVVLFILLGIIFEIILPNLFPV